MASILPDGAPMSIRQSCLLCGGDAGAALCNACHDDLPVLQRGCPRCAEPTPQHEVCGRCLQKPPAFDRTLAVFAYTFPVDQLVHALKYGHQLLLARWLGNALAKACDGLQGDIVCPMPLHASRLTERGFNQAAEIAKTVAGRLCIPLETTLCHRVRPTPSQADLALKERAANVRNAFFCDRDLRGKHVLLVDDVMTTGATLHECAKALKQQGASEVSALVVARALKHGASA